MRNFINRFGAILAVAIIVFSLIYAYASMSSTSKNSGYPTGDRSLAWYIDEQTGEESVRSFKDNIPPLPGPNGNSELVIACKFKADNEKEPTTYYLVKYSDEARQRAAAFPGAPDHDRILDLLSTGRFVRLPDQGSPWISALSPEAAEILRIPEHTPGHPRIPVYPHKQ